MITLNKIRKLLKSNGFEESPTKIMWGHSDIATFKRADETICVQHQDEEPWALIFREPETMPGTNSANPRMPLATYNGFDSISSMIELCRFAANIRLTANPTMKLRPCDCKDMHTASKLNEQGIGHNDESITVEPNVVVLKMGHTTVNIPMDRFFMFAQWYLEEQEIKE